jgi:hypothetical protein
VATFFFLLFSSFVAYALVTGKALYGRAPFFRPIDRKKNPLGFSVVVIGQGVVAAIALFTLMR